MCRTQWEDESIILNLSICQLWGKGSDNSSISNIFITFAFYLSVMNPPIADSLILGRQLSCPEGALAQEVGDYIFASNQNMIYQTINRILVSPNSRILEAGFGNAKHLPYLFQKTNPLHYTGIERSAAMIAEAEESYSELSAEGKTLFLKTDNESLPPLPLCSFEAFFSVNTYYFIEDLQEYFSKLHSLLTVRGQVVLGYIDKEFGMSMPFAREVFKFRSNQELEDILLSAGFTSVSISSFSEEIVGKGGRKFRRPFHIAMASK